MCYIAKWYVICAGCNRRRCIRSVNEPCEEAVRRGRAKRAVEEVSVDVDVVSWTGECPIQMSALSVLGLAIRHRAWHGGGEGGRPLEMVMYEEAWPSQQRRYTRLMR